MDPNHTTLAELAAWAPQRYAGSEAIADDVRRIGYTELGEEIDWTAAALVAAGLQPGDTVAVWAPNIWEWTVAAFATFRAGGVLVPINTRFKGREAAFVLGKARVKVLFTVNGFLDTDYVAMLAEHRAQLVDLERVVVLRGDVPDGAIGCAELLAATTDEHRAEIDRRTAEVRPEDTGLIMFTSGTTGMPKGVMVGHGALIRAFLAYGEALGIAEGERMLVINPFFHAFGFNGATVPCLLRGATLVPHAVFDVDAVLAKIESERITILPAPPAIFQGLLNHKKLDSFDISSLRSCITGAAPISAELVVQMRERLGFETVLTAYGMTETSGLATLCSPEDDPETIANTSGKAIDGVELRIVDDEGRMVGAGQPGELLVRGFQIMKGYLDDPEQTAEAVDADGWLHTGDVAVMDERGYIDITDRKKDMFIVGGFNAYPAEIERMMIEHPDVGQVAVVGVPDERLGEVGAAFVVAAPRSEPDPDHLIRWCRAAIANYKVPRYVWVVESLPLNPSNKVLKYALRDMALERIGAAR